MDALNTLAEAGITIRAYGDTLEAFGRLTDEHRQFIRAHKAELLKQLQAANDPAHTSHRWRITHPDGRVFELSTWPPCTLAEVQADNPGAQAEPIPEPSGGSLAPEDKATIEAVCLAWGATPDELADAIAEASANPTLMDGWRREGRTLGLDIGEDTDDRITCRECRLLKPGSLCSSPAWGPRYHPPPLPHRCPEFLPKAGDPDQRTGVERWPQLKGDKP